MKAMNFYTIITTDNCHSILLHLSQNYFTHYFFLQLLRTVLTHSLWNQLRHHSHSHLEGDKYNKFEIF